MLNFPQLFSPSNEWGFLSPDQSLLGENVAITGPRIMDLNEVSEVRQPYIYTSTAKQRARDVCKVEAWARGSPPAGPAQPLHHGQQGPHRCSSTAMAEFPACPSVTPQPSASRPHLIAFCFTVLHRYCIFYQQKVCGNPVSSDDGQHFLAIKYFLIKVYVLCVFFRHNAITRLIDYNIE